MKAFLKSIDALGGHFNFNYQGKEVLQSSFGGFITIFISIITALLIIGFGQDFYKRINPVVNQETLTYKKQPNFQLDNKNLTLAFRFEDEHGNLIENEDLLYITFEIWNFTKQDQIMWNQNISFSELHYFNEELFYSKSELINYSNWLCPELNGISFGGSWDSDIISMVVAKANKCPEGSFNNKGIPCGKEEEFQSLLKNTFILA